MKKAVILGARESGAGAALLAQKQGWDVFVSDGGPIPAKFREELLAMGVRFEEGQHTQAQVLSADLVIKSPGIPEKAEVVQAIRSKGIPLISEIEFASRYTDAKIIAITGANGKTTTTLLTHWMLTHCGVDAGLAGNVGTSFAKMVATESHPYYVVEVSSFQLDDIQSFRPWISVLLNITPDHLDRYGYSLQNYADAKFKIAVNQTADDHFIWCMDDEVTAQYINEKNIRARIHGFCLDKRPGATAWFEKPTILAQMNQDTFTYDYDRMNLKGRHNVYNTMAAAVIARVMELRNDDVRDAFTDFRNVEHRLEKVAVVRGVEFINDSKATNVNSAWFALESIDKPVIWIAGGVDKGNDYSILVPLVEKKVKTIVGLGKDVRKIHEAFGRKVNMIVNTESMDEAVKMAYHLSDKGDCVLLSPACASFDLFENYEDRGRQFKKHVMAL